MTALEKLWSLVRKDGDCFTWLGHLNNQGSPVMWRRVNETLCPRFALWKSEGKDRPINHVFIRPICDNELCINPEHQVMCSRKEADKEWRMNVSATHRLRTTEANRKKSNVTMTMEKARAIRQRYAECHNAAQVAREFGVRHDHAHKICRNVLWAESSPWAI
jgi:hypothetical protein